MEVLRRTFRPEFLNRIDEIVTFEFREGDHVIADTKDRETFTFRKEAPVGQPADDGRGRRRRSHKRLATAAVRC